VYAIENPRLQTHSSPGHGKVVKIFAVPGGQTLKRSLLWIAFAAAVTLAPAQTILQVTSGTGSATEWFGQSFTTPAGGPWNHITFNFFSTPASGSTPASTPAAAGTAFLLTQEYLGTPAALSSSTPGFLASSVSISGGAYVFAPNVLLNSNTKYWIYENASITASGSGTGGGPSIAAYFAFTATSNFTTITGVEVANFTLGGTAGIPGTPIPPSLLLTIGGLGCLGLYQARRRFGRQV